MMRTSVLLSVLIPFGLAACRGPEPGRLSAELMNRPAPDFELTALDGDKVKLSDYRGRPVLISFFGYG